MANKTNVAVIPARKGSKRFPGKNRAVINGKSLVEHAIVCAFKSGIFEQIILSTDDEHFFNLSEQYSYLKIRQRAKNISKDDSTPFDVLLDVCKTINRDEQVRFCYLQPTSPLRVPSDLNKSISNNSISVYYDEENRFNNIHNVKDTLVKLKILDKFKNPLKSFEHYYFNGLYYWIDKENLIFQGGLLGVDTQLKLTPIDRSHDIDLKEEFIQAKLAFNEKIDY